MCDIKEEPVTVQPKKQKIRSFPMPKQINYYILNNYGYKFYNAQNYAEKLKILQEIIENLKLLGFEFTDSEIERRLKNMKSHYRRKKCDMDNCVIQKTDWEYFDILHDIFTRIAQENQGKAMQMEMAQPASKIDTSPNAVPKAPIVKRKLIEINKPDVPNQQPDDVPLDMSVKKFKVLEFNNFKEVVHQLPISTLPNDSYDKKAAITRIVENLKVVDQARLSLDEQRLKLEIRRNDLDKLGHQLSDVLFKLITS